MLAPFVLYSTENTFCSGDHVSWHNPLDNSESRIQHMLLTEDPQMLPIQTPFGSVSFLQVSSDTFYLKYHTTALFGSFYMQMTHERKSFV